MIGSFEPVSNILWSVLYVIRPITYWTSNKYMYPHQNNYICRYKSSSAGNQILLTNSKLLLCNVLRWNILKVRYFWFENWGLVLFFQWLRNYLFHHSCTELMMNFGFTSLSSLEDGQMVRDTAHSHPLDGNINSWSWEQEWVWQLHACLVTLYKIPWKEMAWYKPVFIHDLYMDRVSNKLLLSF